MKRITSNAVALPRPRREAERQARTTASRRSSSTPTTPRCGPTTWRTGRCTSTSTPRSRTSGCRTSGSRPRPAWCGFVNAARGAGFTIFGLTGRNDDPEGRDARQPRQGRLPAVRQRTTSSPSGRGAKPADQPSYVTCADSAAARRSSTRPAPASTSRRTSATTSCSTSATSGPTSRAGTPTECSSCPTRRTTCPAPTSPGAGRPSDLAAHALHDEARRLERPHRGR